MSCIQDNIDHDLIDSLLDEFDQSSTVNAPSQGPTESNHVASSLGVPSSNESPADSLPALFENLMRSMPSEDHPKRPGNLQESIAEAARMINSQPGQSSSRDEDEDEIIRKLMEEFQIGSESNLEESVEKLMSQMLSAEALEQPVKQVTARYPVWLEQHGPRLSDSDRSNYEKQYAVFKRMCAMIENGEAGANEIMDLLTEIQTYGQPPREIIQELVPGLEFNSEGEPVLQDLPPELANLAGDQPNCSLM